jgi:hypothetical protein
VSCAIDYGRNLAGDANAAGCILVELALAGLGYDYFRHCALFSSSGTTPAF